MEQWMQSFFINDLPLAVQNHVRLFADDCLLYTFGKTQEKLQTLQEDLDKLQEWQDRWEMKFNPKKCKVMQITYKRNPPKPKFNLGGVDLEEVKSHPYLGVQFDNNMKWGTHIDQITSKANKTLGFIKRNLWFAPQDIKASAYKTLVRPTLEYASCAWDPHTKKDIKKIESIQRRAARFVTGNYKRDSSVTNMLGNLNWETLQERRKNARLSMLYKIQNNLVGIDQATYLDKSKETRTRTAKSTTLQRILLVYLFTYLLVYLSPRKAVFSSPGYRGQAYSAYRPLNEKLKF